MKTCLRRVPLQALLAAILFLNGACLRTFAQDASLIGLIKSQNFEQSEVPIPVLVDNPGTERFRFELSVDSASPGSVTGGGVTPLGGATHNLVAENDSFRYEQSFSEKPDLDGEFPAGSYTVSIVTANDGTQNLTLVVPADDYPNVPRISNWGAAQNIDSSSAFTLEWDAFAGGTTADFIMLEIESNNQMGDSRVYESPGPDDETALNGESLQVSIPALTFSPGGEYTGSLSFYRFVSDTTMYSREVVAFHKKTQFRMKAAGGMDTEGPSLSRAEPSSGTINVKDISIVAFRFSEPMNTGVDYSQAIAWTGVSNPNNFSYTWSADGTRLFCQYPPTLPLNATIGWTLNPPPATAHAGGSQTPSGIAKQGVELASRFEDAAGNPLQSGQNSGEFTTAPNSNASEKDVLQFDLLKVKSLFQEGATVSPDGFFSFEFNAKLNGFNTVSSIDVTAPGASAIRFYSEENGDAIEVEASYAEKSDLDGLIPNGNFAVQFNTFHDGSPTVNLNLSPDSYPNDPMLLNHALAQTIDPTAPFSLTWNAMDSPGMNDAVLLFIQNSFGNDIFETPHIGEPNALPGSATTFTIPANTLPPGRTFDLEIAFVKRVNESTEYAGVNCGAFFATVTGIEITTAGDPIMARLDMERVDQGQFKFRVLGEKRFPYTVESSEDFINWTKMYSRTADENIIADMGSFEFTEFDMPNPSRRFYRTTEGEFFGDGNGGGNGGGPQWDVVFFDDLDLNMCAGGTGITFCCQRLSPDGAGNFSETWSPDTPILNVNGSMNDTAFSASLQCATGGMMGSMSATKNGAIYEGTYSFYNSGTIMVLPVTGVISVQGRVIENGSGNPIAGATITTTVGGSTTSDANGFFFLQTNEPVKNGAAFPYCIDVRKPGTHSDSEDGGCMDWGDHVTGRTFTMDPLI